MKKTLLFYLLLLLMAVCPAFSQTWERCNNGITADTINCIKTSDSNIFIGTNKGVFLSTNNGNSWNSINNGLLNLHIVSLDLYEKNIYVCTDTSGVFKSTDFGIKWDSANNGLYGIKQKSFNYYPIAVDSVNIFVCPPGGGLFKSSDKGKNWKFIYSNLLNKEFYTISIDNDIIALGWDQGFDISKDKGKNWSKITLWSSHNSKIPLEGIISICINKNKIFLGTDAIGMLLSTDTGKTLKQILPELPHNLFLTSILIENKILMYSSADGIKFTNDTSNNDYYGNFRELNNGLTLNNLYNLRLVSNKNYYFTNADGMYRLPKKVFNIPNVKITGVSNSCKGDTSVFSTEYEEYNNTNWRVEGGTVVSTPNDSNVTVLWNSPGTGRVILTKQNNTTQVIDSSAFTVTIYDIPTKPIASFKNDTLFSTSQNGNQWFKNGDSIVGATEKYYAPKDSGYYSVQVTINGCSSGMSEKYWVDALGVYDVLVTETLILSPNPVSDFLEISVGAQHAVPLQNIEIFSVLGTRLLSTPVNLTPTLSMLGEGVRIDVSSLPTGIYFVKVGDRVGKFVKI